MVLTGGALRINGYTRFGGEIRVEIAEATRWDGAAAGPHLEGRAFDYCDGFSGDEADHLVTWRGQHELFPWLGQPVRLRFRLRRARLHAFWFE
jgi:hypothetical protein